MKRICPYFVLLFFCCTTAIAGPFLITVERPAKSTIGPFIIPDTVTRYRTVMSWVTKPYTLRVKVCYGRGIPCRYENRTYYRKVKVTKQVPYQVQIPVSAEASPTPMIQVRKMVSLVNLPRGSLILEPGSGSDARVAIALAKSGYKVRTFEIDRVRYEQAKNAIKKSGYSKMICLQHGNVTQYVNDDVDGVVAYMYPDVLSVVAKGKRIKRFVSYMHSVPGLRMSKSGDIYVWSRSEPTKVQRTVQRYAVWAGRRYAGPVCNNPNCAMCNSIQRQLVW